MLLVLFVLYQKTLSHFNQTEINLKQFKVQIN
jgi:hypothetical protein